MKFLSQTKNLIVALIIISFFSWAILKLVDNHKAKTNEVEVQKTVLKNGIALIEQWNLMSNEYQNLTKGFLKNDPAFFKRFIEDSAQSSKIEIESLSPSREENELFIILTMALRTPSKYRNLLRFLNAIEEKSIWAEKIKLEKIKGQKTLEVNVTLKTFIVKE